jgi:hypothetical protein
MYAGIAGIHQFISVNCLYKQNIMHKTSKPKLTREPVTPRARHTINKQLLQKNKKKLKVKSIL